MATITLENLDPSRPEDVCLAIKALADGLARHEQLLREIATAQAAANWVARVAMLSMAATPEPFVSKSGLIALLRPLADSANAFDESEGRAIQELADSLLKAFHGDLGQKRPFFGPHLHLVPTTQLDAGNEIDAEPEPPAGS